MQRFPRIYVSESSGNGSPELVVIEEVNSHLTMFNKVSVFVDFTF